MSGLVSAAPLTTLRRAAAAVPPRARDACAARAPPAARARPAMSWGPAPHHRATGHQRSSLEVGAAPDARETVPLIPEVRPGGRAAAAAGGAVAATAGGTRAAVPPPSRLQRGRGPAGQLFSRSSPATAAWLR
jgi:hypothetical protein